MNLLFFLGKDHTERPFMAWQMPPALSAFIKQPVRGTGRPEAVITGPCPRQESTRRVCWAAGDQGRNRTWGDGHTSTVHRL